MKHPKTVLIDLEHIILGLPQRKIERLSPEIERVTDALEDVVDRRGAWTSDKRKLKEARNKAATTIRKRASCTYTVYVYEANQKVSKIPLDIIARVTSCSAPSSLARKIHRNGFDEFTIKQERLALLGAFDVPHLDYLTIRVTEEPE